MNAPGSQDDERSAGLAVEPLSPARARQMGLDESGLLVTQVAPGSRAADAGFRPGDVIQELDGAPVGSSESLRESLATGDRPALVLVRRGEQSLFLTIERQA